MLKKAKKKSGKRIATRFLSYGGYVLPLNLFKNTDGRWFKVYTANLPVFDTEKIKSIFPITGYRVQIVATCNKTFVLIGVKADLPEDAAKQLEKYDTVEWMSPVSPGEWFQEMSMRLTGCDFIGFPDGKKKKAIDSVMPYNVTVEQTALLLSDKTIKTILLIGYPSKTYAAFTTELLNISDKITISLHITHVDTELCLEGLKFADDIREKRKETMRAFLSEADKNGTKLYQTACLVNISGNGDETERIFKSVIDFCKRYLTDFSQLDFQQKEAFISTLPLLQNQISYNTVLTENNVLGLCPWSKLKERQNGAIYGEDTLIGKVMYNRFIEDDSESGCILSSKREVVLNAVLQELSYLTSITKQPTIIIDDSWSDFKGMATEEFELNRQFICNTKDADPNLYRQMVIHWAQSCTLANGKTDRGMIETIHETAMKIEPSENFLPDFMASITDTSLKNVCHTRSFPEQILVDCYTGKVSGIVAFVVKGTQLEKELAYSYIVSKSNGFVYALDMELLAVSDSDLLQMSNNAVYTFSSTKPESVYRTTMAKKVIEKCKFVLLGEHRVSHKIALIDTLADSGMYLSKKEQKWISEPAKGTVLITGSASYTLIGRNSEQHSP